jgi:hypothetical protein
VILGFAAGFSTVFAAGFAAGFKAGFDETGAEVAIAADLAVLRYNALV